jgi:hypothetical protein
MEAEITFKKRFQIREDQNPADIGKMYIETMGFEVIEIKVLYDPNYGDDIPCECGHPYYRHFDTYDDMEPVGCKYCNTYVEGISHREEIPIPEGTDTSKWVMEDWMKVSSICTGFKRKK